MPARDIIVIGGSAGGFDAIRRLAAGFPADLPAAVFVTIHVTGKSDGILPAIITSAGPLVAVHPTDGEPIKPGKIFVAPPDYHLVIRQGHVHLGHGPRENMQRPCINAMFRSAASSYGERVAGVLLSGLLDDGAAGLWEIQQHHGTTVVQEPEEATFRSMPDSAIRGLNVQYIVRLSEMAPLLTRLAMTHETNPFQQPTSTSSEEGTTQTCPECGGVMTATRMGDLIEFRCHVGHRFGLRTLLEQKSKNIERLLEMALAQSEELSRAVRSAIDHPDGEDRQDLKQELHRRAHEQEVLRSLSATPHDPAQTEAG
ncbi:chemotaxis protein CheB [Occallatibacter savannae]|uniref:chemotaxis protein CheB n=1 Tax=Occallatibacter savannae TaxID=1002691 RepID=UPI000D685557|nr:chemotaxis protein CheB [Occallatibacter savannae]